MKLKQESKIKDLLVLSTEIHEDHRGSFRENWRNDHLMDLGIPESFFDGFLQNNVSVSHKGVIRGLHNQGWSKLMTVAIGEFRMIFVDKRPESPTYNQIEVVDVKPGTCVYVPAGVANGAQSLEDNSVLNYIVTGEWTPDEKYSGINPLSVKDLWVDIEPIISEKDLSSPYEQF